MSKKELKTKEAQEEEYVTIRISKEAYYRLQELKGRFRADDWSETIIKVHEFVYSSIYGKRGR